MTTEHRRYSMTLRGTLLFMVIGIVQGYLMCSRCNSPASYAVAMTFAFLLWVILWKGNEYLSRFITRYISWTKAPARRLVIGVLGAIVYTLTAVLSLLYLYEYTFELNFGRGFMYTVYGSIVVTIIMSLAVHSHAFLMYWRQADMEREKYEKESIVAKYENLKSQINPHFLFNSFNALTNLIYEDRDKAAKFIKQLSEVYRYVLETRDKEVVSIEEELQFLQSYAYLQQIRFGRKLKIEIDINNTKARVAPLALQMLVENAIKHNTVSDEYPLNVRLYMIDDYISVENSMQPKNAYGEPSAGMGLENITRRYEFLSERKVEIIHNEKYFIVKLPVLTET